MRAGSVVQDPRGEPRERGKAWRLVVTAGGFAWFWLYALYLGTVVAFIARRRSSDDKAVAREMRAHIQRSFRRFLEILQVGGAMRFEIDTESAERLRAPNLLIVANHPTMIDAAAVLSQTADAVCVAKREDWTNPFLRSAVRASGMIPNVGGRDVIAASVGVLKNGASLILFPEGTRSPAGGLGRFQRGAAHVALESGFDIVPVRIACDPPSLGKGEPWYVVPSRAFVLRLEVGERVLVSDYQRPDLPGPLAARMLTSALEEDYAKWLVAVASQRRAS